MLNFDVMQQHTHVRTCTFSYSIKFIGIRPLVTDESSGSEDDEDDDFAEDGEALWSEEENYETESDTDS